MRRKVISKVLVTGYQGYPSTVVTLECGHDHTFRGRYLWEVKQKTKQCDDCDRVCLDCGQRGATRGPCPYGSEIHTDHRPVDLCKACAQKRAEDI